MTRWASTRNGIVCALRPRGSILRQRQFGIKWGMRLRSFVRESNSRSQPVAGVIWWVEPLFPGYFLARFDLEEHLRELLHLNGVSGAVQFGRVLPEVPAEFVEELRGEFSGEEDNILSVERKLGVGDEVELVQGAFSGVDGVILEVLPSTERVKVLLDLMGERRPVEIDIYSLLVRERA